MKTDLPFEKEVILGLKIDVDTFRGTKYGVPALAKLLDKHGILGTFFFSIGPDNMGRNLWRLFNPRFFIKMLRGNAVKLYGVDILFKGVFYSGPDIGSKLSEIMRQTKNAGHEIALHANDHYKWQRTISEMTRLTIKQEISLTCEKWYKIFGEFPKAAGNPGWQLSAEWLDFFEEEKSYQLLYRSDCRGQFIGYPKINGRVYSTIQIPTTLPTFDEVIGIDGINEENYNDYIFSLISEDRPNILTIHAEVEGIAYIKMFEKFLEKCKRNNIKILPLKNIYETFKNTEKILDLCFEEVPGREGKLAVLK